MLSVDDFWVIFAEYISFWEDLFFTPRVFFSDWSFSFWNVLVWIFGLSLATKLLRVVLGYNVLDIFDNYGGGAE